MQHYKVLDGNSAVVEAVRLARVRLISAYPITPQSPIAEKLSELADTGALDADYIRVESEHSAASAAIGGQLTGIRACTATSSVGLALMHEVLNVASGCRVPLVVPIVNRSLASPWSLWCDHQDSMAERDSGWIQLYCENVQDILDSMLMAYRIAEHPDVQTPVMVCQDGFFLSHSMQKLLIPDAQDADAFIGPYIPHNLTLDPADPVVIDNLIGSSENTEMRYQAYCGMENARRVMPEVFAEFEQRFGRSKKMVEGYRMDDAEIALVSLGSVSGTVKYVVDRLRADGCKIGAVKVVSFRPFPFEELAELLDGIKYIAVIDRSASNGCQGSPLYMETCAAIRHDALVRGYVAGLAGRDISIATIRNVVKDIRDGDARARGTKWIDCAVDDAMTIREVMIND